MANALRFLAADAVEQAQSGHPGLPMGMADVATVLYTRHLRFDAADPEWPDRDRFVLSGGHGSMLLYALLYLTGNEATTLDELKRFRQLGSKTPGHPEVDRAQGVETTTGPLGQGISTAVGMAIGERVMAARFGEELVNHRIWVLASDGDMMEGVSHETGALAGHLGLGNLIVFYDDNGISIDGPTDLAMSDDVPARFRSYGWDVQSVDGHEPDAVDAAIERAKGTDTPSLIACRTTIGYGAPEKAGTAATHGAPLGSDEVAGMRRELGWDAEPFDIPEDILHAWRTVGRQGAALSAEWRERYQRHSQRGAFDSAVAGEVPDAVWDCLRDFRQRAAADDSKEATRKASGRLLEELLQVWPSLLGGSADLTPSNNTQPKAATSLVSGDYAGRYIHYGVREHAMAAAMNGLALHGGVVPYGGTFLTFSDYMRPAMRLAALMAQRVVFVMTHDSIGLGEDGPTHQPIEHLAALRAIPNLRVFRPADSVEMAECWECALAATSSPSVVTLTRQGVPALRGSDSAADNHSARGAYVLAEDDRAAVTLLATGSEVGVAIDARDRLAERGIHARVVSMPCWELFEEQSADYREQVLGSKPRVAVEAACAMGWDRYLGAGGRFVGMSGFGASAPGGDLFSHFGITAEHVAAQAQEMAG